MSDYHPDKWLVVKINSKAPHYRVFACWYGGYLGSDSWKLNSGITTVAEDETHYHFSGTSGSVYVCNKQRYGANGYGHGVLANMIKNMAEQHDTVMEIVPEETDFMKVDYECN